MYQEVTYAYDAEGNIKTQTDAMGNVTAYDNGTKANSTYPDMLNAMTYPKYSETYDYDKLNRRIKTTRKDSSNALPDNVTEQAYDNVGRMAYTIDANRQKTSYGYANAQLTSIESVDGAKVTFSYDAEGNIKTQTDAMGNVTAYDNGTATNSTYPDMLNKITYPTYSESYAYDKLNRRVKTTRKDSSNALPDNVTEQAYDNVGRMAYTIDANRQKTSYGYDDLGRQIKETNEAANETTQYDYDAFGNLNYVINANDVKIRAYTYDKRGLTKTEVTPDGRAITFEYDSLGRMVKRTNPKGQIEVNQYANGVLTTKLYYQNAADVTTDKRAEEITYAYDKDRRLTIAIHKVDNNLSDKYVYNYANGQLTQQDTTFYDEAGTELFTKTLKYSYYPDGQLKSYTNAENIEVTYAYNGNNQLTKLSIPNVGDITQGNFDWIAPTKVTYPNGVTTDYAFDGFMRVKQIHTKNASTDIMKYDYSYDKVGNITQKATEHGTYRYGYDRAYRLISAVNPTLDNERYTYDKVGNRLTSAKQAGVWAYNDADQLLSNPSDTFTYDANGHTKTMTPSDTSKKATEYVYDVRERLADVKKDNATLQSNRYDFQERRLAKVASGTTYFLYGETGLVGEYQSDGDFIQGYGYKPKGSYTTNPQYTITPKTGTGYKFDFYHNDHLATPQKLSDKSANVSWSMESSAFGEVTIKTQTTKNNLRFPGQYADSDIGLNQNFHRDYALNLGRYAENDPIGLEGGINTYIYVGANSLKYHDIYGLAWPSGSEHPGWRPSCICKKSKTDQACVEQAKRNYELCRQQVWDFYLTVSAGWSRIDKACKEGCRKICSNATEHSLCDSACEKAITLAKDLVRSGIIGVDAGCGIRYIVDLQSCTTCLDSTCDQ